ncbi:protein AGENET DOMAIN (AGD)-CONTAINING P1-like [Telopea speciosissima]|uniref:protein AGENET DOMAIN (AGD)-CONTAINING P1-like n=1 Tax=Telopea speciosissima TaxID=54955 RepID=UPI001CC39B93|nr:protein AGENET DOMAIN (AGD)-CONTAINING P1-like [Telopea speciosissima]
MKKSSKNLNYRIGDSVEVHSNEEGYVGSFYEAKVLDVSKNHVLMVEYKTLVTPDESKWLRERVHVSQGRPRPPQLQVSNFNLSDEVDAYDNEGWWVGRITRICESKYYACFDGNSSSCKGSSSSSDDDDDDEINNNPQKRRLIDESKYYVYFSTTQDLIAYPLSRLRLHQEWKNGKWFPYSSGL